MLRLHRIVNAFGARKQFPGGWLTAALGLFLPLVGHSAGWNYEPSVEVGAQYESNPTGESQSSLENDAYAGIIAGSVRMTTETSIASISFAPRAEAGAYTGIPNASELNYVDYFLPLEARRTTQLAQYNLRGGFTRTSTRNFPGVDPNQDPGSSPTDPGPDEYQERWYAGPSAAFQLTPLDVLSLSLSYDNIRFTEPDFFFRSNYEYGSGDLTWTHALNERHRVSLGGNVTGFRSEFPRSPAENESVTYGANLGYEYSWSESTSIGAAAGTARTDITVKGLPAISTPDFPSPLPCLDPSTNTFVSCEVKTDDSNFVGQVFFRQKSAETITTQLSASRSIQPNSDGAQVTLDVISGFASREFSPLLSGSIGASYSRQEAVGAGEGSGRIGELFKRDYMSFEASLTRRLTRTWQLRAAYSFYQDEQADGILDYKVPRHRLNFYLQYSGLGRY